MAQSASRFEVDVSLDPDPSLRRTRKTWTTPHDQLRCDARRLAEGQVDFIVVGEVAAAMYRAARATYDDVVYSRPLENIARLVETGA